MKVLTFRTQAGAPIGRNERCPCGSGRKFKVCHLDVKRAKEAEVNPPQEPANLYALRKPEIRA